MCRPFLMRGLRVFVFILDRGAGSAGHARRDHANGGCRVRRGYYQPEDNRGQCAAHDGSCAVTIFGHFIQQVLDPLTGFIKAIGAIHVVSFPKRLGPHTPALQLRG